jgi:hypothetical protein
MTAVHPQAVAAAKFLAIVVAALLVLTWLRGLLRFVALALLLWLLVHGLRALAQKWRAPVD